MRVALLLSGTARWFEYTQPSITKFLVEPYQADVFIHTYYPMVEGYHTLSGYESGAWPYSQHLYANEQFESELYERYHPVKIVIEDFHSISSRLRIAYYEKKKAKHGRERIAGDVTNTLSQWRKVRLCRDLKTSHEIEQDFHYDIVIRCRFDLEFRSFDLDLSKIERGTVYLPYRDGWGEWVNEQTGTIYAGYVDNLALGDSSIMDLWCGVYTSIDYYYSQGVLFNSEALLKAHGERFNVPIRVFPTEFRFYGRGITQ